MSAIAGIIHFNQEPVLKEMGYAIMKHFSSFPANDVQQLYHNGLFFGCHAQWLTPESIGEVLPFYDRERKRIIVVDAIIDNREELLDLFRISKSHRKRIPDSQIILMAYDKWEEECPKYLIGDFVFMIWDENKKKLFGARDFSGGRTLYYFRASERFVFSTLIQPLFKLPYIKKQLNEQWLAEYLAIAGMVDVVDTQSTPYVNIQQIPPSHSLTVERNQTKLTRYCHLGKDKKMIFKKNDEYVEAFQEVYQQAVTARLRTNKKVGAQLSGGLDSGSVAAYAQKQLTKQDRSLHTFSYIPSKDFEDFTPRNIMTNETPYIQSTLQYIGGIQEHFLDFDGRDSYSEIDSFLEMMEMPYKFFENSFWMKGIFEKADQQGVGILLTGGRGNLSVSWGSALEYYVTLFKRLKWCKLNTELNHFSQRTGGPRYRLLPKIIKKSLPKLSANKVSPYPLIHPGFAKRTKVYEKLRSYGFDQSGWFRLNNIYKEREHHFEDLFHWNATNTVSTKLSLQHSLWKRDPTNDLRVIRFCLSLPESQYVQNGYERSLIRRATKDLLPDQVRLNQRIKGVQGADWVHRMKNQWDFLINELEEMLTDPISSLYLNNELIKEILPTLKGNVKPNFILDPHSKIVMRSIIVHRFLKQLERR
ncbi:asparagine synthase-related protein [Alkalihalobacillus pseudalcaliphilus]|uniref:asparagine synthase-related protein n=1 Tax=Alkalihalobacillus pseudalcaliphilus TaxID=79884 RepID=UPI00064DBCE1|nr:asparagine synthase-related protein [Alkalihalobacillus pseudalcaliphilus]KMK75027.1 asparagine synthase [Alkalihalobacillus pseudalcaliphilus]